MQYCHFIRAVAGDVHVSSRVQSKGYSFSVEATLKQTQQVMVSESATDTITMSMTWILATLQVHHQTCDCARVIEASQAPSEGK